VFFVYGMHWHFNLVTGRIGEPHAVLVRAVEPIEGTALMSARRGIDSDARNLANGPGKLCQAFAIDGRDYAADLCKAGRLYIVDGPAPKKISRSERIGVDYAGAWARKKWRFFDAESPFVSRHRSTRGASRKGNAS
jgi:DNA-3-methyladenine glycosylase